MEGVVQFVHQESVSFVVEADSGFTVFGVVDMLDLELGDEITGDLDSTTCDTVFNETKEEVMEVFVQDIVSSLLEAKGLVFSQ